MFADSVASSRRQTRRSRQRSCPRMRVSRSSTGPSLRSGRILHRRNIEDNSCAEQASEALGVRTRFRLDKGSNTGQSQRRARQQSIGGTANARSGDSSSIRMHAACALRGMCAQGLGRKNAVLHSGSPLSRRYVRRSLTTRRLTAACRLTAVVVVVI